jgi:hypothetical protein
MGNFCCSDDLKLTTKFEESLSEPDPMFIPAFNQRDSLKYKLETVKEENLEDSQQSD